MIGPIGVRASRRVLASASRHARSASSSANKPERGAEAAAPPANGPRSTSNTDDVSSSGYSLSARQRRALGLVIPDPSSSSSAAADDNMAATLSALRAESAHQESLHSQTAGPAPFHQLLLHPARAVWRSSSHSPPPQRLVDTLTNILTASGRTGRQLRRTYNRIISSHLALADRRERERRRLVNARRERVRPDSLRHKAEAGRDAAIKPVTYGPEQTVASLRYRLVPNYAVTRRVLDEARSLLGSGRLARRGGTTAAARADSDSTASPRIRIIDAGCGVGSASAAALDVFGPQNVDWVHGVDPSRSMREGFGTILRGVVDGATAAAEEDGKEDNDNGDNDNDGAFASRTRPRNTRLGGGGGVGGGVGGGGRTRITVGETLGDGAVESGKGGGKKGGGGGGGTGTFDLALCAYAASELPHVSSALAMAVLLWEKLGPDGVLVVIEPGTPDGFNTVRAIRNMLLDCCPPDDRHAAVAAAADNSDGGRMYDDGDDETYDDGRRRDGDEECHVIAPCTHNGKCPMERHRKDDLDKKHKKQLGTLAAEDAQGGAEHALPIDEELDDEINFDEHDEGGYEFFDTESHPDWTDEDGREIEDLEEEDWEDVSGANRDYSWAGGNKGGDVAKESSGSGAPSEPKSPTAPTNLLDRAFCSFVHSMPGGDFRSKGEKFSYLVLQKRITGQRPSEKDRDEETNPFHATHNVADLLAASLDAGRETPGTDAGPTRKKKHQRAVGDSTRHADVLRIASDLEDSFLDSDADHLALELVRGDSARKSYGRIVRAPIKRRGHICVDYCAGRTGSGDGDGLSPDGGVGGGGGCGGEGDGRIVRHRVSRKVSARVAPGMYGAARKARWGGLWPDVSDRIGRSSPPLAGGDNVEGKS